MSIQPIDSRTQARNFVEADSNRLAKKAYRNYKRENREANIRYDKHLTNMAKSLPVVAAASALILGKGVKPALKEGASWGAALVAPVLVMAANNVAIGSSKKLKKAEKRHEGLAIAGFMGASYAGFKGLDKGLNKLAKSEKVNKIVDAVIDGVKGTYNKVKPEIKVPESVSKPVSDFIASAKSKAPDFVKRAYNTVKNSETTASVIKSSKSIGKSVVGAAPVIVTGVMIGSMIGKAIQEASKYNQIKNETKNAQFETAKELINVYDVENKDLKAENEVLKSQLAAGETDEEA